VLATGSLLGDYRVEAVLGRGGMGVVYRATQVSLGRSVALKVIATTLAEQPGFKERFERESRLAASLDHPNIIPVYAAGEHDGVVYIAMRHVEGVDLRELIAAEGRLDPGRAARIVAQVAWALEAAHARGLVHRDVKPANVLVTLGGDVEHVYLTDFGVTKRSASESRLTAAGEWVGTVDYVSPEQLRGDAVDARADVYALGCVLYEALTGRVPFPRDNELAKLWGHMSDRPTSPGKVVADVPRRLAAVAERAMAKAPRARFATAGDFGRAALAAVPSAARALGSASGKGRRWQAAALEPRNAFLLAGVALVAFLAVGAALLARDGGMSGQDARARPALAASAAGRPAGAPAKVGDSPHGIAVGAGAVWVANTGDGTVSTLDLASGRVRGRPIAVGEDPTAIAVGAGGVWVVNHGDGTVTHLDPHTRRALGAPIPVGKGPVDVAVDSGAVWVSGGRERVVRIDPRAGRPLGPPVGVKAQGPLAFGAGRLWAADRRDGTVQSIDVPSGLVLDTPIEVDGDPADLTMGANELWVTVAGEHVVKRVDLRSGKAGGAVHVGGRPEYLARQGNALWVTDAEGDSVSRIDMRSGRLVGGPIRVGEEPGGVAVGAGAVWVTSATADTVTRIVPR
jgi:DNA-binding beta-propeller fold protein YncE/predicted Ser/Thr protein kinase